MAFYEIFHCFCFEFTTDCQFWPKTEPKSRDRIRWRLAVNFGPKERNKKNLEKVIAASTH